MPNVPGEEVVPLLHKVPPAQFPKELREFRNRSIIEFCKGMREIIDEVNPKAVYAQNWINDQNSRLGKGLVDVVLPEFYQKTDLIPLGMKHRITKTYFDNGPIWGNVRHSVRHDGRHFPVPGTRMLLVDCVANHAVPLMLDLCAMDFDAAGQKELSQTFAHIKTIQKLKQGSEPVKYAALLHSLPSFDHYSKNYLDGFEGIYRVLLESHIQFEVINEDNIHHGILKDFKVLVIPNAPCLSENTLENIRIAVKKGMGLICSFETGFRNEKGKKRKRPPLADLLGADIKKTIPFEHGKNREFNRILGVPEVDSDLFNYGRIDQKFFTFHGGFVVCEPCRGTRVPARVRKPDIKRLKAKAYNRRGVFPGKKEWPLALVRELGKARLGYFSCEADAQWRRIHAPELDTLLNRTILWCGGRQSLEAQDVPPSVEVRFFHNPAKRCYFILLVNLNTNALVPSSDGVSAIRYVVPHNRVSLILRGSTKIKNVKSLLGSKVKLTRLSRKKRILLDKLDLYDCIILEY
jgi:hypothetical protein